MGFPMGRRTIHDYTSAPVSEEILRRALEAAMDAPCHKLTFPWRFTRVGPSVRGDLVRLNLELKSEKRVLSDEQIQRIVRKMERPAELLVISQVRTDDPLRAKEDYAAVACAIQNLCLSLHDEGVGSKWSSGVLTRHPRTYALTGVPFEGEEIVGFVWVGYAAVQPVRPERPALDEVLRRTR